MIKKKKQSQYAKRRHNLSLRRIRDIAKFQDRFFSSPEWKGTSRSVLFKRLLVDFERQGIKEADIKELDFNLRDAVPDILMIVYALRTTTVWGPAVRMDLIEGLLFHATSHLATAAFILSDGVFPVVQLDAKRTAKVKAEVAETGWR